MLFRNALSPFTSATRLFRVQSPLAGIILLPR
jgi:hypothetical protein